MTIVVKMFINNNRLFNDYYNFESIDQILT